MFNQSIESIDINWQWTVSSDKDAIFFYDPLDLIES